MLSAMIATGLLAASAAITSGEAPWRSTEAAHCPKTSSHPAVDRNAKARPQRLAELPPANAYASVYRRVNGCEVPVVVRYNVGGRTR